MVSLLRLKVVRLAGFFNSIRDEHEFQQILRDVEAKYEADPERVREWLEEQGEL